MQNMVDSYCNISSEKSSEYQSKLILASLINHLFMKHK